MKMWLVVTTLFIIAAGFWNGMHAAAIAPNDVFVGPDPGVIPAKAMRFRVIANSNQSQDQAIKREIRDRVLAYVGPRLDHVTSLTQAKSVLRAAIPGVETIAEQTLEEAHMPYGAKTTLGPTPFPTKLYGNRVYPAGIYEALRITLGQGAGENWWCVLFPPLCFVALTDGDAVAATNAFPDTPPLAVTKVQAADGKTIPVALRLASVDYGSLWWRELKVEAQQLYQKLSHGL